jgi:hypothetical protein
MLYLHILLCGSKNLIEDISCVYSIVFCVKLRTPLSSYKNRKQNEPREKGEANTD